MSSEPMTEKRLAEIQAAMREPGFPEVYKAYFQPVVEELGGVHAENERLRAENQRLGYEIQTLKLEREELPSWEGLLLEYRHRQGLA